MTWSNTQRETYCLILNGVQEMHDEIVDDVVLKVLNTKMEAGISIQDIERAHRLHMQLSENSFSERDKKSSPIMIKFASYHKRQEVFRQEKKRKGSSLVIAENLTKKRQSLFNRVKEISASAVAGQMTGELWHLRMKLMNTVTREEHINTITREEDLQRLLPEVSNTPLALAPQNPSPWAFWPFAPRFW